MSDERQQALDDMARAARQVAEEIGNAMSVHGDYYGLTAPGKAKVQEALIVFGAHIVQVIGSILPPKKE